MVKRSARRKNLFLTTLRNKTIAYINEQNKAVKQQLKQIVVNTKNAVEDAVKRPFRKLAKQGVIRYYHKGKEISENDSNFGKVYADAERLPIRMQAAVSAVMQKYSEKIFAMSQKLVPVDKRYAYINSKDSKSIKVKSYRRRPIVSISKSSDISFYKFDENRDEERRDLRSFRRLYEENRLGDYGYSVEELNVGYGWYSGKKAEFIKRYLSGTNDRGQHSFIYNKEDGLIYQRDSRGSLNFSPSSALSLNMTGKRVYGGKMFSSSKQPTGGFQELREGGKLTHKYIGDKIINSTISYSAFDETRKSGNRYNYAALQHDNLAFKHKYGQALYLSEPVKFYKDKYLKEVRERLKNNFKKGV